MVSRWRWRVLKRCSASPQNPPPSAAIRQWVRTSLGVALEENFDASTDSSS